MATVYLTFEKGNGAWGRSETKPVDFFKYDFWGPFENDFEAMQMEHELRGIPPPVKNQKHIYELCTNNL